MSDEIKPYEIFVLLPNNLDVTKQLSVEEQASLRGAPEFYDRMTPAVRQMCEVAIAKCDEVGWENLPSKNLYTARIAIASVEQYVETLRQIVRDDARIKGGS